MRGQAVGKNTTLYNVCFYGEQNKGVSLVFERGQIALACSIFLDHGPYKLQTLENEVIEILSVST